MKGSRPNQAELTKNNDLSKTKKTQQVIESMVDGLNDHRIEDIGEFFSENFRWMGNFGCGTKSGLKEYFPSLEFLLVGFELHINFSGRF